MLFTANYTISQQDVSLSARRPVRAQWLDVKIPAEPHDHAYHEICLVLQGLIAHRTATGETQIHAGRAIVVPPKAVHALRPIADVRVINVYYLAEWLATDLATLWAEPNLVQVFLSRSIIGPRAAAEIVEFDLTSDELCEIARDLHDIEAESKHPSASNALIRGAFLKVLARLSRASSRVLADQKSLRPQLWKVITQIERLVQTALPLDL